MPSLSEIQQHSTYVALTDKQKKYVDARCSGQSPLAAAKHAFDCKDDRSASARARAVEKENPSVRWLIRKFEGDDTPPTRDEYLSMLWSMVRRSNEADMQLKALDMIAKVSGFYTKPADSPAAPPPSGDEPFDVD